MRLNIHQYTLILGIIAPGIFFIVMYLILPFLHPDYNSIHQHISQLGAINSPVQFYANFFGFYLFGVLLMLFSYGSFKIPQLPRSHRVSITLLFLTGTTISLIAFFPCDLACTPKSHTGVIHLALAGLQLFLLICNVCIFSLGTHLSNTIHRYSKFFFFLWLIPSLLWFSHIILDFHNENVGLIQRTSLAMTYLFVVFQGIVYHQYYRGIERKNARHASDIVNFR